MDRRSVGEDNKGEEERGIGAEEMRQRGEEEERMRGGGGRTVFLVIQVLEIPAGGRGFPLVGSNQFAMILLLNSRNRRGAVKATADHNFYQPCVS